MWFAVLVDDYQRPWLGWIAIVTMTVWTPYTIWRYRHRSGRTNRLVLLDQVVVTVVFATSEFTLTDEQMLGGLPTLTTLWHSSMITAAAAQWGMLGGGISGVVAAAGHTLARGYIDPNITMDALLMVGPGLLIGLASDTARRSTERLTRALRAEASTAERERLARSIHDSVLQVLARVRRRGTELGGEAAELARLAGEQEVALRALVAASPAESPDDGSADLAGALQVLNSGQAQVSVPATQVWVPAVVSRELTALVREALENVERHAGPDAGAWVLLEDLGDEVVVSVRDNGPGIPDGRLGTAESEGRMGVAQSIRGRVHGLGGTISLDTAPGEGTEWEVRVPRTETSRTKRRKGVAS
ncbi:ATP-binding protein [Allosaccharopolyspora coralli]|uniref:ATP-binding protein n=1 Tax=Allosaccharopolyspora coralli TaxID=2665642 RepID=A0A5Q3QP18_9PSEU|nr:ATP-binding protein [Allosaccharopolyspora coralli]